SSTGLEVEERADGLSVLRAVLHADGRLVQELVHDRARELLEHRAVAWRHPLEPADRAADLLATDLLRQGAQARDRRHHVERHEVALELGGAGGGDLLARHGLALA